MKILLSILSLLTIASCSVSEPETAQMTESNVSVENSAMLRGGWTHTINRSDTSGSDWRDTRNSLSYSQVWDWLIQSHQKRSFNFHTEYGMKYWFNYTFFNDRKDVWYSIVRDGVILQTGWTTVELLERKVKSAPGHYLDYGLIKFDVLFNRGTSMPQNLMVQYKKDTWSPKAHRGVIWGGMTDNFDFDNIHQQTAFKNGAFYVNNGHIQGTIKNPSSSEVEHNDTSGSDWRDTRNSLSYSQVWDWLIQSHQKRSFNYHTENGVRTWFNYTFFNHRKDVWYSIIRNGVILQTGWTTVELLERKVKYAPGHYLDYGLIKFDVLFRDNTSMPQNLMVQYKKGHRGVIWGGMTDDFDFDNIHQLTAFKNGAFYVNGGHVQ